jgi:hypothetical protein
VLYFEPWAHPRFWFDDYWNKMGASNRCDYGLARAR